MSRPHLTEMNVFQVTIKVKSRHVGGAFSKNNKCKSSTSQEEFFPRWICKISKSTFIFYFRSSYRCTCHILGTVYEIIHDSSSWPFRKERENMELHFGVKTAQGLLEFKCRNKVDKQKWVLGIQNLLQRRNLSEEAENSLRMLHINTSI